jgi:hypothetical protein
MIVDDYLIRVSITESFRRSALSSGEEEWLGTLLINMAVEFT